VFGLSCKFIFMHLATRKVALEDSFTQVSSFLSVISTEDVNTCSFAWFSELVELLAFTGMAMWHDTWRYVYEIKTNLEG